MYTIWNCILCTCIQYSDYTILYSILYILVYLFITSVKNPILFEILPLNQPATFNKCALYININVCRTVHPKTKVCRTNRISMLLCICLMRFTFHLSHQSIYVAYPIVCRRVHPKFNLEWKCAVASTLNCKVCRRVQCRSDLCRSVQCRSVLCHSVLYPGW